MVYFTRLQLYEALQNCQPSFRVEFLKNFIFNKMSISECSHSAEKDLYNCIHVFLSKITQRKSKLRKSSDAFVETSKLWLEKEFVISNSLLCKNTTKTTELASSSKIGRPKVAFEDASLRSKKRKCSELLSSHSLEEIASTTAMALYKKGKRQVASFVAEVISSESIPKQSEKCQYSDDQALSLFIEGKFTKFQYNLMRSQAKELGSNLYPSYDRVLEAKRQCYPNGIKITDSSAEVFVQSLLNHTASRLLKTCETVLNQLDSSTRAFELIVKWGFDGSSGHSQYKQNISSNLKIIDQYLFATWLVPLELRYVTPDGNISVLWNNSLPSSVRYCRPLRFQFLKETAAIIKAEEEYVTSQINQLV